MREHLYRGFYETNNGDKVITLNGKQYRGEWVEGNLFVGDDGECEILIGTKVVRISYPVIPETVGKYTGIIDKNNNKIFEGNIVNYTGMPRTYMIDFHNDLLHYSLFYYDKELKNTYYAGIVHKNDGDSMEVIGNIFETPELLEKN